MILRMENVGEDKHTLLFYGVDCVDEVPILRQKVTHLISERKKLENETIDTWDRIDCGTSYAYLHKQQDGTLVYKNVINSF